MTLESAGLAAARGLHLLGLLSALGTLGFLFLVLPRAWLGPNGAAFRKTAWRLVQGSLVLALLGALVWLPAQTAEMAGEGRAFSALPTVLGETFFGRVFILRLVLIALALLVALARRGAFAVAGAFLLVAAALLLQPGLGHGAAATLLWLPLAIAGHVFAAGLWLGALLPLWLLLRLSPPDGAQAARCFSLLGIGAVATIAATALSQWTLIGGIPGLVGTAYGRVVLAKLAVFAALLVLAACNRWFFTPAVLAEHSPRSLRISIAAEVVLGLLVVALAALLSTLPPGAHEQPVWPFPRRLIPGLLDDPYLVARLRRTLVPVAGIIVLVALGIGWRRMRWPAFLLAGATIFVVPALPVALYLQPAFPTTFYASSTAFTAASVTAGGRLFGQECAGCHAADARGRGPLAETLPVWPPDLTAPLFRARTNGDLFWHLREGFRTESGVESMPGFAGQLDDEDLWRLIDFVRARSAARAIDDDGRWTVPVRVPAAAVACPVDMKQPIRDVAEADGRFLLLVAAQDAAVPPQPILRDTEASDVSTIVWDTREGQDSAACRVDDPTFVQALALTAGTTPQALARAGVLVDGSGWMRHLWRDGPPASTELSAELRHALANPVAEGQAHH